MARRKVPYLAGQYYHLFNRGNGRQKIFFEQENYRFFLERLHLYFDPANVETCAYCLMPNHFHVLFHLLEDCPFHRVMQKFAISYTKSLNVWSGSVRHVFQGSYQIRLVDSNEYLSQLCRYIHLNPVKGHLAKAPELWPHSDFAEWISSNTSRNTPAVRLRELLFESADDYRDFVLAGLDDPDKISDFSLGKSSDFSLGSNSGRNQISLEPTRVAVGVIKNEGKYLICQRKRGGRYELKWEFPGGKLEKGESTEDCLRRELQEELSIRIHSIDRVETHDAYYEDGGMFSVAYCFVAGYDGDPQNNVFEQIRWVTVSELKEMDVLDGNKAFIANLTI